MVLAARVCFVYHVTDTDSWAQNGSAHGCVFATLKTSIFHKHVEKLSENLLSRVFFIPFQSARPVVLFRFGSPLNRAEYEVSTRPNRNKQIPRYSGRSSWTRWMQKAKQIHRYNRTIFWQEQLNMRKAKGQTNTSIITSNSGKGSSWYGPLKTINVRVCVTGWETW